MIHLYDRYLRAQGSGYIPLSPEREPTYVRVHSLQFAINNYCFPPPQPAFKTNNFKSQPRVFKRKVRSFQVIPTIGFTYSTDSLLFFSAGTYCIRTIPVATKLVASRGGGGVVVTTLVGIGFIHQSFTVNTRYA